MDPVTRYFLLAFGAYALFLVFTPGLLLCLPPVAQRDCKTGRPIDHAPILFGGHTSVPASIVHALLYGAAVGLMFRSPYVGAAGAASMLLFASGGAVTLPPARVRVCPGNDARPSVQSKVFFSGNVSPAAALWQSAVGAAAVVAVGIAVERRRRT